ncbi:methyltransferase domain-containing protein [Mesorhizobium plurifarium]|uniref:AMP-binding protein n=1 Tax=Sinorhizobium arboris TaxID=76745 RepID=UPI0004039E3C|nr:AMP-binding protein [Sinorhizobium arboris]PST18676.1 methyltransferase domain-containing protein [Mesorhizobium plurifarium]
MSDLSFLHRIHEAGLQDPRAIAIEFHGETISYGALAERIAALSATFLAAGVSHGSRVGLHLRRSPDLVATLLSVLTLGATFVPLPVDSPAARNKLIAEMADLDFLVVDDDDSESFPAPARVTLRSIAAQDVYALPIAAIDDETLAYIMFTSGSTGRPKGVMVHRRNIAYFVDAVDQLINFRDWGKMVAATTFGFDISVLELLLPLARGGTILLADDHESKSSEELIRLVAGQDRCLVQATPAMWRMIVSSGWFEDCEVGVLCGGEALPFDLARTLHDRSRAAWNLYGPTETTIWSFGHRLAAEDFVDPTKSVPIGRPLSGTGYTIEAASEGDNSGELRITGPGVAAGYFRRPDLNAGKFVVADDGDALEYRTGDIVEERSGGCLAYVGRKDRQLKLNGFRIEPGEIEHVLERLPGVMQSAVKIVEGDGGLKHLVAYIVADEQSRAQAIESWGSVWDATYRLQEASEMSEGTGYTSTFTGSPIEEQAVRTWARATADRVLRSSPESVLDVGCGVGLLGEHLLLAGLSKYHGCDLSSTAIESARNRLMDRVGSSPQWSLSCAAAHDLRARVSEPFDVVLLNSVVQYFPDKDYLSLVLREAIAACRNGGKVIIGDIPATSLKSIMAAEIRSANAVLSDTVLGNRAKEIGRGELWLDPAEFDTIARGLKRVAAVEIDLRLGDGNDEMTRFRYDTVLHLDSDDRQHHDVNEVFDFIDIASKGHRLSQWLDSAPSAFILRKIPNRRILEDAPALNYDGRDERSGVDALADLGPHEIRMWAKNKHRSVCIRWSEPVMGADIDIAVTPLGSFSPAFERSHQSIPSGGRIAAPLTWAADRVRDEHFRKALSNILPHYMIPSEFVYLSRMPLTYNGKVDYSALPAIAARRPPAAIKIRKAANSSVRDQVADVWSSILNIADLPLQQSFFSAGGSSILVAELARQLSDLFEVKIPLVDLFVHTTVTSQAAHIEALMYGHSVGESKAPEVNFAAHSDRRRQVLANTKSRRTSTREI